MFNLYSYSIFLKNYKNYGKNIFVLTHSNRFSFFDNFNHVWTTRISNINETIEHNTQRYNYNLSNVDKKIYKNALIAAGAASLEGKEFKNVKII